MGLCLPCLNGPEEDLEQPDPEERRRQQAAAAEKRVKAEESRGVKNPEALKRKQQEREKLETEAALQERTGGGGEGLKWNVG